MLIIDFYNSDKTKFAGREIKLFLYNSLYCRKVQTKKYNFQLHKQILALKQLKEVL